MRRIYVWYICNNTLPYYFYVENVLLVELCKKFTWEQLRRDILGRVLPLQAMARGLMLARVRCQSAARSSSTESAVASLVVITGVFMYAAIPSLAQKAKHE